MNKKQNNEANNEANVKDTKRYQKGCPIIEYETEGKFGKGYISIEANGARVLYIKWNNAQETRVESTQVNLKKSQSKNLEEVLFKACHNGCSISLYQKRVIKGPKALISAFYSPKDEADGYATITKKDHRPLRFCLSRINLTKMKCNSIIEALQKIAFVTGKVSLTAPPTEPTATSATAS